MKPKSSHTTNFVCMKKRRSLTVKDVEFMLLKMNNNYFLVCSIAIGSISIQKL